jgi:Zn ribbon nucleic-acid-binding protein
MALDRRLRAWSDCGECGFQGTFEFSLRDDEIYDDPESLGVMLDAVCPACGEVDAVLMMREPFDEMVRLADVSDGQ